jgi:hypothetical protein
LLAEGVALARRLGDRDNLSRALLRLAAVALYDDHGDALRAGALYRESLLVAVELAHPYPLAYALEDLAAVAAAEGRPERAAVGRAAAALWEATHAAPVPRSRAKLERVLASAWRELSTGAGGRVWCAGREMRREQAVADALAVVD